MTDLAARRAETRVVNRRVDRFDVYIGRPSKWGNPFTHLAKTRAQFRVPYDEVLPRYEAWLREQPELMAALGELEELHATLERDVVRIGERQQQIEKLRKERG